MIHLYWGEKFTKILANKWLNSWRGVNSFIGTFYCFKNTFIVMKNILYSLFHFERVVYVCRFISDMFVLYQTSEIKIYKEWGEFQLDEFRHAQGSPASLLTRFFWNITEYIRLRMSILWPRGLLLNAFWLFWSTFLSVEYGSLIQTNHFSTKIHWNLRVQYLGERWIVLEFTLWTLPIFFSSKLLNVY